MDKETEKQTNTVETGGSGESDEPKSIEKKPKPSEGAQDKTVARGPGRPSGAKNRAPKIAAPRSRRKKPHEVSDTRTYIQGLMRDLDLTVARHNELHGGNLRTPLSPFDAPPPAERDVDPGAVLLGLNTLFSMVRLVTGLTQQPSPEAMEAAAVAWTEVIRLTPVMSPLIEASVSALILTGAAAMPLVLEATGKIPAVVALPGEIVEAENEKK